MRLSLTKTLLIRCTILGEGYPLHNIASALHEGGYGYLFISVKSSTSFTTRRSYIEIVQHLITHYPEYHQFFEGFRITRANLNRENYPEYIEQAGLILNELVEIKAPFIFDDKLELSQFLQGIIAGFLIFKENILLSEQEKLAKIEALCNHLVNELLQQGTYNLLDDGRIHTQQSFLLAIVKKPEFAKCHGIVDINMNRFIIKNLSERKVAHPSLTMLLKILDSGPPAANTRSSYNESENQANFLELR